MMDHTFAVMAYKDSPYLIECLESLRNQSVQSRIYISTSTPSDFLTFIATKYGVELHTSNRGGGIAQDWNAAYQLATTKYVTLVHQDDIYLPDYLKECLRAAEKFPDTLICFTDYDEIIHGEERKSTLMLDVKRFMLNTFLLFRKNLQSKFWKNALQVFTKRSEEHTSELQSRLHLVCRLLLEKKKKKKKKKKINKKKKKKKEKQKKNKI